MLFWYNFLGTVDKYYLFLCRILCITTYKKYNKIIIVGINNAIDLNVGLVKFDLLAKL